MAIPRDIQLEVDALVLRLRRRQLVGSHSVALATALLMRHVVSRWGHTQTLICGVKAVGRHLVSAMPSELVVGNVVRRVLHVIREELYNLTQQDLQGDDEPLTPGHARSSSFVVPGGHAGILSLMDDPAAERDRLREEELLHLKALSSHNVKPLIIDGIKELIEELEHIHANMAAQSLEHIHSNEIILTLGKSRTVESFLKYAAKTRRFQVIVAETGPEYAGQELAVSLAAAGLDTTLIPDSAIFAVMSRVNKVILGCHAVTANGGLVAVNGSHVVATAAKHHSTPVVVCTGMYKLSPIYPYDTDAFNTVVGPEKVFPFEEGDLIHSMDVVNPYYNFVPPDLISLFITNVGPHPPNFIYRVLTDQYSSEDITLEELEAEVV